MFEMKKSIAKASSPIALVVLVNVMMQILKQKGVEIDESIIWNIAGVGYGAVMGFINWLKNRNKAVKNDTGNPPVGAK